MQPANALPFPAREAGFPCGDKPSLAEGARRAIRRFVQRRFTNLPYRTAPFAELVRASDPHPHGIHASAGAYSGVLSSAPGEPYRVRPIRFVSGGPFGLASDDAAFFSCEPTRTVYALAGGGVYGNHGRIYSPRDRAFVEETCDEWDGPLDSSKPLRLPRFPKAGRLPGITVVLSGCASETFYHFFVEILPKLALLQPFLDSADRILVGNGGETWKGKWLRALGIADRVLFVHPHSHYLCDQVLFTSRVVAHFEPNPWAASVIRRLFPPPAGSAACDALWLDRRGEGNRSVAWEDALLRRLPELTPVRFDALDAESVIALLGSARFVAGLHGAAFAQVALRRPGLRICEIFAKPNYPYFGRMAQVCGHEHTAIAVAGDPPDIDALAAAIRGQLDEADPARNGAAPGALAGAGAA